MLQHPSWVYGMSLHLSRSISRCLSIHFYVPLHKGLAYLLLHLLLETERLEGKSGYLYKFSFWKKREMKCFSTQYFLPHGVNITCKTILTCRHSSLTQLLGEEKPCNLINGLEGQTWISCPAPSSLPPGSCSSSENMWS